MIDEQNLLMALTEKIGDVEKAQEVLDLMKSTDADTSITDLHLSEEVKKGIFDVLVGGQSYKIGNRFLERAKLRDLMKLDNELQSRIGSGNNSLLGNTTAAYFGGR